MTNDPGHDLHPSKVLERPKVVYNRTTKEFVMWMHIDSVDYAAARVGVAVSSTPMGPFRYLGSFRPDAGVWPRDVTDEDRKPSSTNVLVRDFNAGQMARDLTVFVDDDGKAYLFYASEDNATMHVSLLTPDYHHTTGEYARVFIGRSTEAPAVFKREENIISSVRDARRGSRTRRGWPWRIPFLGRGANCRIRAWGTMRIRLSFRRALLCCRCRVVMAPSYFSPIDGINGTCRRRGMCGCRWNFL